MAKKNNQIAMTTELVVIAPQLNEVAVKSGLELTKAEKYAAGYQPLMGEVLAQAELLRGLNKESIEDAAKAKRVSLDLGKICSKLTAKKKDDKDILLIETRLIDGLFNVAESTARLTQKEADEIVDYLPSLERERLASLANGRRAELEAYGAQTAYLPLDIMGDEQYARCLEDAKLAFNARKEAAEKAERDRIEAEQKAEAERAEALRLQVERIESERLEAIRVKAELAEKEALLERERIISEKKLAEEQKRAAADLAEKDKQNYRQSAMFGLGMQWDGQSFTYHDVNFHWTDLLCMSDKDFEKAYKSADTRIEFLKSEKLKKDQAEREQSEKLAKELQAKKDAEAKELAAKKAAELAPDKDKINQLYLSIRDLQIPSFSTADCKELGTKVSIKLTEILAFIKEEGRKLS